MNPNKKSLELKRNIFTLIFMKNLRVTRVFVIAFFALAMTLTGGSALAAGTCDGHGHESSLSAGEQSACVAEYDACMNITTPEGVADYLDQHCTQTAMEQGFERIDIGSAKDCIGENVFGGPDSTLTETDASFCFAAGICLDQEIFNYCDMGLSACCTYGSTEYPGDHVGDTPQNDPANNPADPSDPGDDSNLQYVNSDYGFSVTFPQGWEANDPLEDVENGVFTVQFRLPTSDTSFSGTGKISMVAVSAYPGGRDSIGMMEEYIGENSGYAISYSHLNGDVPADLSSQIGDLDTIKNSISVFEPGSSASGTTVPGASASTDAAFSDVSGHRYQTAITYVKDRGVINGYDDGTYKPDNNINRAEFTKIMMGSTFDSSQLTGSSCFTDVGSDWFAPYVCAAKNMGILGGYPDGSFKPANNINLAEALKIIWEATGLEIPDNGGEWYQKYFDISDQIGLLNTINRDPGHYLTRGEMAELVYLAETME